MRKAGGLGLVLLWFGLISSCCYGASWTQKEREGKVSKFIADVNPGAQAHNASTGEEDEEEEEEGGESGEDEPGASRGLLECVSSGCKLAVEKTNTEINNLVNTVLPAFKTKAQQQKVDSEKIDFLTAQITSLKNDQQNRNNKIDKNLGDFYVAVEKAKSRQTPNSQQHAERALQSVQALGAGIMNLQKNLGKPDKQWEIIADMATMTSTIMSIIPNPYSKSAAVFLNVVAQLIGIATFETKSEVNTYIEEMKTIISKEFTQERAAKAIGALNEVKSYRQFLHRFKGRAKIKDWKIYMRSRDFPTAHIGARDLGTLEAHIKDGLSAGRENTYTLIVLYARLASFRDDVFTAMIQMRPDKDDPAEGTVAYANLYKGWVEKKRETREGAFKFIDGILNDVNKHSVMALHKYFPVNHDADSKEIYRFYSKMTYQESSRDDTGVVVSMPPPAEIADGKYYLETAQGSDWAGYFLSWEKTDVKANLLLTEIAGNWARDAWIYSTSIGDKVGIDDKKDRRDLKITTTSDPVEGSKTIELLKSNKMVTYFNSAQNTRASKSSTRVFCRGKSEPLHWRTPRGPNGQPRGQFIETRNKFRFIPLVRSAADKAAKRFPVVIGDAIDDYFLRPNEYKDTDGFFSRNFWNIYMKPLALSGTSVESKFIWNLYEMPAKA